MWILQDADPVMAQIRDSTEEGKKVSRNNGSKWEAVFRRIDDASELNTDWWEQYQTFTW